MRVLGTRSNRPKSREGRPIYYDIGVAAPAVLLAGLAIISFGLRRRASLARIGCELAFLGYLVGVASVTVFPIITEPGFIGQMRQANRIVDGINLVPLGGLDLREGGSIIDRQMLLNVVMGVPFGVGLPFLGSTSARRVVVLGIVFAMSIELAQLAIDLVYQFAYRTVDVNDVVANVIGVTLGVGLFRLIRVVYGRLGLDEKDVGRYIDAVMSRPSVSV